MKNTSFKVEHVFGDNISKNNCSQEQIIKSNSFFSQSSVSIIINIKVNLFKPRKKNDIDCQPSAPPE